MATTYWPDGAGGNTIIKYAPGVYVYSTQTTASGIQDDWNTLIKPYKSNWIDESRGHRVGFHHNVVGMSAFTDSSRPSSETNPANYDWSSIDDVLAANCFTAEGCLYSISLRFEANSQWHFPDWWPESWKYLPTGTSNDRWIPNWGNSSVVSFMKNFATAFASKYNTNAYFWTWGIGEQSGVAQLSGGLDGLQEFVEHAADATDKMMFFLNQNREIWDRAGINNRENIAYRIPDPRPFGCDYAGSFPANSCGTSAGPGTFNKFCAAVQSPLGGKRRLCIMSSESNGFNIIGTTNNVDSPWGENTTFPLASEQSPNADMTPAVFVWYHSYVPRETGAASTAFNHDAPDPGGILPCTVLHQTRPNGSPRFQGIDIEDIDRAYKLFGQAGTQAFPTEPYGWQTPGGITPVPLISSVTDASVYDGETGTVIAGSNFGATQGTGWVRLYSGADQSGTSVTQTITSWGDTSITFTAVQGALTAGTTVYLFVHNNANDTSAAYSIQLQSAAAQPTITDLGPTTYNNGATITLAGTDFGASRGSGQVTIYENSDKTGTTVNQSILFWSNTSIIFIFNLGALTAGDVVYLVVKNNATLEPSAFPRNTTATVGPTITDIGDEVFVDGEQNVVITGNNFGSTQGSGWVELNNSQDGTGTRIIQFIKTWSSTQITFDVSIGSLADGENYIFVYDTFGTKSNHWQVNVTSSSILPSVFLISPSQIYNTLTPIIIVGNNFGVRTTPYEGAVLIGINPEMTEISVLQPIVAWSNDEIIFTFTRSSLPLGAAYLQVISVTGERSTAEPITIIANTGSPVISSVSDSFLTLGEAFTINGANFGTVAGVVWLSNLPYVTPSSLSLGDTSWIDSAVGTNAPTITPSFGTGQAYVIVQRNDGLSSEGFAVTIVNLVQTLSVDDEHSTDYSDTAGFSDISASVGAIVLENSTTNFSAASLTFSHTLGVDDDLFILRYTHDSDTANTVSSVTYGGVTATQAVKHDTGKLESGIYYIYGSNLPSPGANNVVINSTATANETNALATSYSGAEPAAPDATETDSSSEDLSVTGSLTTTRDDAWVIDVCGNALSTGGPPSADAGQTEEYAGNYGTHSTGFGYEVVETAGVESAGWTFVTSARVIYSAAAFIPTSATGALPETWNDNARVADGDNTGDAATYYFYLDINANQLDIYGWWPDGTWATDTPITITRPGESPETIDVDQNNNTGNLYLIKAYGLTDVGTMTVAIGDDANNTVVADLIQVELQGREPLRTNVDFVGETFLINKILRRRLT